MCIALVFILLSIWRLTVQSSVLWSCRAPMTCPLHTCHHMLYVDNATHDILGSYSGTDVIVIFSVPTSGPNHRHVRSGLMVSPSASTSYNQCQCEPNASRSVIEETKSLCRFGCIQARETHSGVFPRGVLVYLMYPHPSPRSSRCSCNPTWAFLLTTTSTSDVRKMLAECRLMYKSSIIEGAGHVRGGM